MQDKGISRTRKRCKTCYGGNKSLKCKTMGIKVQDEGARKQCTKGATQKAKQRHKNRYKIQRGKSKMQDKGTRHRI